MAGCITTVAPPLLSNIWFPSHERITATSISTLLTNMGKSTDQIYQIVKRSVISENSVTPYSIYVNDGITRKLRLGISTRN